MRTLALLCAVAACGDGETSPTPDAEVALVWEPCPLHTTGGRGGTAECTRVEVPAFWLDPGAGTIELFVKRYGGTGTQLWMLNGGPGASGADYEPLAEAFIGEEPSLQVYMLDHRGTGHSSRLGCAAEADASPGGFAITDAEWSGCLAEVQATWGDRLAGFTTSNAARDLGWLIDRTREPGRAVVVAGGSYGTRWAQRYLQIHPAQADAVSLHGIASPATSFSKYDERYDAVARAFLASCAGDAFCRGKLGPDPVGVADRVLANLDSECPAAGLDRDTLRRFFATLMMSYWDERTLIPATIFRLDRCSAGDVSALRYLDQVLNRPVAPGVYDRLYSTVLATNVGLSEFFDDPPTLAQAEAAVEGALASFGVGVRYRQRYDLWPRYPKDAYAGRFADSAVPMLMMQGRFDPATPLVYALAVRDAFARPGQRFIEVPNAPHSFASPTRAGYSCQLVMFFRWVLAPAAEPVRCIPDILPQNFAGTPDLAAYFGAGDVWENPPRAAARAPSSRLDDLRRDLQRAAWGHVP